MNTLAMTRKTEKALIGALAAAPITAALTTGLLFLVAHSVAIDGKIYASLTAGWTLIISAVAGIVPIIYRWRTK